MRRFELNEKDAEFMNNYLWCNGYASMAHGNVIIASDDEDIEVKTILDDNNIKEDTEYWYLTKLAAECSAKRLVPDYISAKKMRELKGDVYPCMGERKLWPM